MWKIITQQKKTKNDVVEVRCKRIAWFVGTDEYGMPQTLENGKPKFSRLANPMLRIVLENDAYPDQVHYIHMIQGKEKVITDYFTNQPRTVSTAGYVYHYPPKVEYNQKGMWVGSTYHKPGTLELSRKDVREEKMTEVAFKSFLEKRLGKELAEEVLNCFAAHED